MLLVGTSRPDMDAAATALMDHDRVVQMPIGRLDRGASIELMRGLGAGDLPEAVRESALERAEGNAFYLEEIVQVLMESGREDAIETLPHGIHGLLASRIDSLSPFEKRVIQAGAVIGRSFDAPHVRDARTGCTGHRRALDVLVRRGLIVRRGDRPPDRGAEHAFRHVLIRDVAYAGISEAPGEPWPTPATRHALAVDPDQSEARAEEYRSPLPRGSGR